MLFKLTRFGTALGAAASLSMVGGAIPAFAETVQPIILDLAPAGRGMSDVVRVQNTSDRPLPVELRIEGIEFGADGAHGTGRDPGDLVVFPAQALIPPGQTQAFRVQYAGDPHLASSRHYYVTVAQLPVRNAGQPSAIQLLYNFQVLVSVAPEGARPSLRVVSASMQPDPSGRAAPVIEIANDSRAYGYLSQGSLVIVERDAGGREVGHRTLTGPAIQQAVGYGLVGAGQTRRVMLPASGHSPGTSVDVRFIPQPRRP